MSSFQRQVTQPNHTEIRYASQSTNTINHNSGQNDEKGGYFQASPTNIEAKTTAGPTTEEIKTSSKLLAFYDSPAEHWTHIRTTNPIESTFATVRHRTKRSKGCLSMKTMEAMVFKVIKEAEKNWLRLRGKNQLPKLITGAKFNYGIEQINQHNQNAA